MVKGIAPGIIAGLATVNGDGGTPVTPVGAKNAGLTIPGFTAGNTPVDTGRPLLV